MNNLNQLSDAELSVVFAVEVAGDSPDNVAWFTKAIAKGHVDPNALPYAHSMDAVLPFITKHGWAELIQWDMVNGIYAKSSRWKVSILVRGLIEGESTSLPRAACIALILAARAEKEAMK